jgi:hypothetical protein
MSQNGYFSALMQGIITQKVNSTSTATTTSGTDAVLLTITPTIAGSYIAVFVGTIQQANAGQSVTTSFYNNGVQDTATVIDAAPFAGGTLTSGSASVPWVTIGGPYTVNGSQAIALEWHVSGGTGTAQQRQLYVIKVG